MWSQCPVGGPLLPPGKPCGDCLVCYQSFGHPRSTGVMTLPGLPGDTVNCAVVLVQALHSMSP